MITCQIHKIVGNDCGIGLVFEREDKSAGFCFLPHYDMGKVKLIEHGYETVTFEWTDPASWFSTPSCRVHEVKLKRA